MKENVVRDKSYSFAIRIIKLCTWLRNEKHFELSQQLIKSGTSIGANIEEALAGNSRNDFVYKLSIASKEAREANYWLRLLLDSGILPKKQGESLKIESEEIIKLLTSIVKTINADSN